MSRDGESTDPRLDPVASAVAIVASTLAQGTPTRHISGDELDEAAAVIVETLRALGHDVLIQPSGVWDLGSLSPGEAHRFAQEALATMLECAGVKLEWEPRADN